MLLQLHLMKAASESCAGVFLHQQQVLPASSCVSTSFGPRGEALPAFGLLASHPTGPGAGCCEASSLGEGAATQVSCAVCEPSPSSAEKKVVPWSPWTVLMLGIRHGKEVRSKQDLPEPDEPNPHNIPHCIQTHLCIGQGDEYLSMAGSPKGP